MHCLRRKAKNGAEGSVLAALDLALPATAVPRAPLPVPAGTAVCRAPAGTVASCRGTSANLPRNATRTRVSRVLCKEVGAGLCTGGMF